MVLFWSARLDRMNSPGATKSGLIRPSGVGPREEKSARLVSVPNSTNPIVLLDQYPLVGCVKLLMEFWLAPMDMTFLAVAGELMVPFSGPLFPAETTTIASS